VDERMRAPASDLGGSQGIQAQRQRLDDDYRRERGTLDGLMKGASRRSLLTAWRYSVQI
jgi:hypothetical protein